MVAFVALMMSVVIGEVPPILVLVVVAALQALEILVWINTGMSAKK